ncbi:MAG: hypothetical protein CMJ76_10745 [Planctomycetaceae bacterium]|nr:hypothetical protein [Planctomycetaceae bacterium]|tara:strand:- start:712 stop:1710 length:999 start_codon:yes stop_codon:yes gene_type:complete
MAMPNPPPKLLILLVQVFAYLIAPVHTLGQPPITDVAVSSDRKSILYISQRGLTISLLSENAAGDKVISNELKSRTLPIPAPNLHSIRFSPTGTRILICGGTPAVSSFIGIYSWPELTELKTHDLEGDSILTGIWLDRERIATAGLDNMIRIWNTNNLTIDKELAGHSDGITSLATFSEEKILISAGLDNSLRVWNLEDYSLTRSLNQHIQPVQSLAFNRATGGLPLVASASDDRTIRFWQPTIGRMVRFVKLPSKPQDIKWLTDERLAAVCSDGQIYIIDTLNVEILVSKQLKTGWCYAISAGSTNSQVIICGSRGVLEIMDISSIVNDAR